MSTLSLKKKIGQASFPVERPRKNVKVERVSTITFMRDHANLDPELFCACLGETRRVWRVSTGVKIDLRAYGRKYYAAVEIYLKSQFKRSFTKMIVTRAGRLLE